MAQTWLKYIIVTALISLLPVGAHTNSSCADIFKTGKVKPEQAVRTLMNYEIAEKLLISLKQRSDQIFDAHKEVSADQIKALFESYLDLRLALLPPKQARSIRELLAERPNPTTVASEFDGHYNSGNKSIHIMMPEQYINTGLDFAVRVHELEHAIQHVKMIDSTEAVTPYPTFHPKTFSVFMFEVEKAAMVAESIFLHALPTEYAKDLLASGLNDKSLIKKDKKIFFEGLLGTSLASNSAKGYVETQWAHWRYSRTQFLFLQISATSTLPLVGLCSWLAISAF